MRTGLPRNEDFGFCLIHAAYDLGYVSSAYDIADKYREVGDSVQAARFYGVAFGYSTVERRLYPLSGDVTEFVMPDVSHFAFHEAMDLMPDDDGDPRMPQLSRAFSEGIDMGVGQTGELRAERERYRD